MSTKRKEPSSEIKKESSGEPLPKRGKFSPDDDKGEEKEAQRARITLQAKGVRMALKLGLHDVAILADGTLTEVPEERFFPGENANNHPPLPDDWKPCESSQYVTSHPIFKEIELHLERCWKKFDVCDDCSKSIREIHRKRNVFNNKKRCYECEAKKRPTA